VIVPFLDFTFKIKIQSLGCFILQKLIILSNTVFCSKIFRSIFFFLKNTKSVQLLGKLVLRLGYYVFRIRKYS
jgi:hypothetical protein